MLLFLDSTEFSRVFQLLFRLLTQTNFIQLKSQAQIMFVAILKPFHKNTALTTTALQRFKKKAMAEETTQFKTNENKPMKTETMHLSSVGETTSQ